MADLAVFLRPTADLAVSLHLTADPVVFHHPMAAPAAALRSDVAAEASSSWVPR